MSFICLLLPKTCCGLSGRQHFPKFTANSRSRLQRLMISTHLSLSPIHAQPPAASQTHKKKNNILQLYTTAFYDFFCIYLSNFDICSFFVLGRCLRQLIQFVIKTNQVFKQMARISCIIGRKLGKRAIWHNMFPSFTHMCNNSKCHPPFLV